MLPERRDSWMFHHPAAEWTHLQAQALGISLATAKTSGIKEDELGGLEDALSKIVAANGIECVVTGAIASEYQKSRIDRICDSLGLRVLTPLWRLDAEHLLLEQIGLGFKCVLVACMAMGLDRTWLGRALDAKALEELLEIRSKYGINLSFEGGEAETFVTDAPIFARSIEITRAEPVWKADSGYLSILEARLRAGPD
jgi:ABC transporter with metal-binding/Fe-S-binding domain ATP-binding protein